MWVGSAQLPLAIQSNPSMLWPAHIFFKSHVEPTCKKITNLEFKAAELNSYLLT